VKFGPVPVAEAEGAILAHSVRQGAVIIRKGRVLDADDVRQLESAGIAEVTVARLTDDDVHEDAAARQLAGALAGAHVRAGEAFTGRSNLLADAAGVMTLDRARIEGINRIDPAITVATLAEYAPVAPGQMVATVKIIPFAVPRTSLDAALAGAGEGGLLRVAPFRPLKVGLVATRLPALKPSVMDKTRRLLEARLAPAGAEVMREDRVSHSAGAVAAALADQKARGAELLIVFGASAVVDAADVIPAAIVAAGGQVVRFGMPVDPGNLLVLGDIGGTPVVGAPGCARSPKENGFDWVLNRLLAGLQVTSEDIARLGVGGLLTEIASRPQPREERPARRKIAALILAAGRSRRMGGPNKLLATVGGKPLVRIAAEAALASAVSSVVVVTGHDAPAVEAALAGLPVAFVDNRHYAEGMSTSVRAGVGALPADVEAVVVMLADMPAVSAEAVNRLISAFRPEDGAEIVVPIYHGRRGNPVLWPARFFPALKAVEGDVGGRSLIAANPRSVVEIELDAGVTRDVDTPKDLADAGGILG
jgi:molybdenum cofactor cytidylyltransferase